MQSPRLYLLPGVGQRRSDAKVGRVTTLRVTMPRHLDGGLCILALFRKKRRAHSNDRQVLVRLFVFDALNLQLVLHDVLVRDFKLQVAAHGTRAARIGDVRVEYSAYGPTLGVPP